MTTTGKLTWSEIVADCHAQCAGSARCPTETNCCSTETNCCFSTETNCCSPRERRVSA